MDYVMNYKYGDGIQLSITRPDRVKHTMVNPCQHHVRYSPVLNIK